MPAPPERSAAPPRWRRALPAVAEAGMVLGLVAAYFASFGPASAVHGPFEIFAQDSVYLLESLAQGVTYPWNPQNHLLHHGMVEGGYALWRRVFGSGPGSAFDYLKWLSALAGLAFLLASRKLLQELGLSRAARVAVLALAGISVSVWFHFAAFETHSLALPALVLYLVSLVRLRDRVARTLKDRALFVGSLAAMGLLRVDLLRFAAVSALLPLLPGARRWWRGLMVDLAMVAALVVAGNLVIGRVYLDEPLGDVVTALIERQDRPELEESLTRLDNLAPAHLLAVGRAVTLYGMIMPVAPRPAGRSFWAPPEYHLDLEWKNPEDVRPSTTLFLMPARNLLGSALSLLALAAVGALLAIALVASARRALAGDPLHAMLLAQALAGWLLYTWFNPLEPFLWVVEFVPLWIVMIAEHTRDAGRGGWIGVGIAAVVLGAHNLFAFYLPFR